MIKQRNRLTGKFWPDVRVRIWERAEELHAKDFYDRHEKNITPPTRKELRQDGYFHRAKCLILREINIQKRPSRIQGLVQGIYESLTELESCIKILPDGTPISMPEEDYFDDWYDSEEIGKYSHKLKLLQFLNTIAWSIHSGEANGFIGTKQDFDSVLGGFVNKVNESKAHLYDIATIINTTYPGLVGEFTFALSLEELNKREADEYEMEFMAHMRLGG